jgi:transmembrane sensor
MTARRADATPREALIDDPALAEALAASATVGRLSNQDVRAMRIARRRTLASAGAALIVAMVGVGGWLRLAPSPMPAAPMVARYETPRGQQRAIRLADGSSLRLSGATRVAVTLAGDRREVLLEQGEAYFDVAHDPARPFTVHAGASSARVLGTAFDLDLRRARVELAVYRGAVGFGAEGAGTPRVVVKAGWRSHFEGGTADAPHRFDTARQDWRQGWLDTEDMTLGDLVEVLNRQGGPLVLPPPPTLAAMPIGGRFRLDDPAQLLEAIGTAYGFQVERRGQALRLSLAG